MKARFAITHVKDGNRFLTMGNQGRYHFDDFDKAQAALDIFKPQWVAKQVLTAEQGETLKVIPVNCHAHGDAVNSVFPV